MVKYHRSRRFLTHPVRPLAFKDKPSANRGQCLVGSLAGAAHLSKGNAGVPRLAQAEGKSAVEQKGKSRLDGSLQCGRRLRKHGLLIPFGRRPECGARGVTQVTSGVTGLWQPSIRSDVAF